MFYGTNFGVGELIYKNEIPATIGNIVGGTVFTGCIFWFLYGRNDAPDSETGQLINAKKKFGNRNRQMESDETVGGGNPATGEIHRGPCDANDMV
jgi:hypothetical protein